MLVIWGMKIGSAPLNSKEISMVVFLAVFGHNNNQKEDFLTPQQFVLNPSQIS